MNTHNNLMLLRRPPIYYDESLESYLIRASISNHYSKVYRVERLAEDRSGRKGVWYWDEKFSALAELTQQPVNLLIRAGVDLKELFNSRESRKDFLSDAPKHPSRWSSFRKFNNNPPHYPKHKKPINLSFCPICLKEAYQRFIWRSKYANICLDHLCLLLDECPNCQNPIGINQILATSCNKCRFNLCRSPIINMSNDHWGVKVQATVQKWMGSRKSDSFDTFVDDENTYLGDENLRSWFLGFIDKCFYSIEHNTSVAHSPNFNFEDNKIKRCFRRQLNNYRISATAFQCLLNWPQGFYDVIDAYRHRGGRNLRNPKTDLEFLPRLLDKRPNYIEDLLDNFIFQHYPTVNRSLVEYWRFTSRSELRKKYPYTSQIELARILGMTEKEIEEWFEGFADSEQNPISWSTRKDNVINYLKWYRNDVLYKIVLESSKSDPALRPLNQSNPLS